MAFHVVRLPGGAAWANGPVAKGWVGVDMGPAIGHVGERGHGGGMMFKPA